ncbi:MAG: hypothetical protein J5988_14975, partial [Eubacterium sp.]|nr:hypothetical protein [Eubacterium sp.]
MQGRKRIFILALLLYSFIVNGCGIQDSDEQTTEVFLMEGETFISYESEQAEEDVVSETETAPVFEEKEITLMA